MAASIISPYQTGAEKPPPTAPWEWGDPTLTPSGQFMPVGDVVSNGHTFHQIVAENFVKPAAAGSWANTSCTDRVVYTGAVPWMSYPSCYTDTWQHRPYQPGSVLSVHEGTLDFWLHPVNGRPAGANPSPVLLDGTRYQTYGRYSVRMRQTSAALSDYYMAFLLWPQDGNYQCAESDFPEANLSSGNVWAFNHQCATSPPSVVQFGKAVDKTAWHTYTVQWQPGQRLYSIDGISVGITYTGVYAGPERWQLQTETSGNVCEPACTQDGHVLIDWAVVYSY